MTAGARLVGPAASARGDRRDRRDGGRGGAAQDKTPYIERLVTINRVAKVVKGGRRFSFTALMIVGDGDGLVGVGYGKAKEVPAAIAKGVEEAKKSFFRVPRIGGTIVHRVQGEAAAGVVCSPGQPRYRRHRRWPGACRAGVRRHPRHPVQEPGQRQRDQRRARHIAALKMIQRPEEVAARRGLPLEDVAPAQMLRPARAAKAAGPKA